MKNILLFFVIACLFTSCNNTKTNADTEVEVSESTEQPVAEKIADAVNGERYGIKSAIVESEMNMEKMGKVVTTKYFDDYGKVEFNKYATLMSVMGKEINSTSNSLMKDGYMYIWQDGATSGTKMKIDASKFDPKNGDFDKLTKEMKDKMKIKDEGTAEVFNKTCKVISLTMDGNISGKSYTWKGITLKSEFGKDGHNMITEVKKLDESPSFAANQFEVPANVTFKEMNTTQAK